MGDRLREIKKNSRAWTAGCLTVALLSLSVSTLCPYQVSASQAVPEPFGEDLPAAGISGSDDIWEKLESDGEVMVSFPSVIEAAISSPEDEDSYTFRLESRSDLTLSLESEYACAMELIHQGQVIGSSSRPYNQILEPTDLEEGMYTVRITPQEHVEASSYSLRISRQADRTKQPDYSEAHIAGTLFDPESPFRMINIQDESEKNRGGNPFMVVHYLSHWQGPVDEAVMPYYDKGDFQEKPSDYIHYKKATPNFHTQSAIFVPGFSEDGSHMEHWKNAIMTYGAVTTGFYTSLCYRDKNEGSGEPYYDYEYFYAPEGWDYEKFSRHLSLIVGWDDTVEKENFRITKRDENGALVAETMPKRDGAWICKDSYSGILPDYYYVSYESRDFGMAAFTPTAFAPPEKNDNYNHLYSNTPGGMADGAIANEGFLRGVQVFQNEGESELLRAVGFCVKQGELSYEIRIRTGDGPLESVKTGYLKYPGFYTVRLDQGVMIPPGSKFEIHVAISGDEDKRVSFYTCKNLDGWMNGVKAIPGKSYYYTDWEGQTEWLDASAQGEYPYICAYTYSPMNQEITLLDNKEAPGEIGKATPPEAKRATGSEADRATVSEAERATDPEADRVTDPEANRATVLEADRGPDPEADRAPDPEADRAPDPKADRAPDPEADRAPDLEADQAPAADSDRAAVTEADRAPSPEADRAITSDSPRATASQANRATASEAVRSDDPEEDADCAEDWDDIVLFDDLLSVVNSGEEEQEQEEELMLWELRNSVNGAIPNEGAEEIEVNPLKLRFPAQYDSRLLNLITKSKNQGISNLCWAFSTVGALEASYLRYGNQMIDYPRGLNLISREAPITDGTITLKLKKGESLPLNLTALLYSDSRHFTPGSPQIYWEISGDLSSVKGGQQLSESGESICALEALAPGRVTVTAVSMADVSLKASCQIEITETAPAKIHVEPETLNLWPGETWQLKTTVEAEEELTVVYTSDRPEIVSVDKNGQVIALKPGKAVITAKAGDGQAVCTVNVSRPKSSDDEGAVWTAPSAHGPSMPDTVRGSWEQDGDRWRFRKDDGSYAISAWERIGGLWYYFKEDTYSATGWRYDPGYQKWFFLEESGAMAVGWRQIDGKWYYFHTTSDGEMGKMYAGERTPDGYTVGADGEWLQ